MTAADWEERYELGDTPWNKNAPHPALLDFLREQPLNGRILVPGCGYGYDVRAISRVENEVIGVDIAPSAIRRAESLPKVANERYEVADLFHLPAHTHNAFDWVWEQTCFCALDPDLRPRYVEAVAGTLKPGGHLLGVFFLKPDMAEGETGPPFGIEIAELDGLFHGHFDLVREWLPANTFEGRENREWMRLYRRRG
jgi:SAM-dependent methyltransferase